MDVRTADPIEEAGNVHDGIEGKPSQHPWVASEFQEAELGNATIAYAGHR